MRIILTWIIFELSKRIGEVLTFNQRTKLLQTFNQGEHERMINILLHLLAKEGSKGCFNPLVMLSAKEECNRKEEH